MTDHDDPVERFLAQAPEPAEGTEEAPAVAVARRRRGLRRWVTHLLFEKEPSRYSSIAPRTPDGRRTRPFFFNGNGRGR